MKLEKMIAALAVCAGSLAGAATAQADVLSTYGPRFVDDPLTGGLWHFEETVTRPSDARLFVPDDNSTGRPEQLLVLRNDSTGASINGTSYYDAQAAGSPTYLNSLNSYASFFEDHTQGVVAETLITMPDEIVTAHSQTLLNAHNTWFLTSIRHAGGGIPSFTFWDTTGAVHDVRIAGSTPLLMPGETYYLRAAYDPANELVTLQVNDQVGTYDLDGARVRAPGPDSLFVGIRGGDRFLGLMHEAKVSLIPEPTSMAVLGMGAGLLLRRRRQA